VLIGIGTISAVGAGGQSMITIVQQLEHNGYGPFSELSMDDGNWEVECRKRGESLELAVDSKSGRVLAEFRDDAEAVPTADAMPLSKLLQTIHDQGKYDQFHEVSFERRYWELEVFMNGHKYELLVDPITA